MRFHAISRGCIHPHETRKRQYFYKIANTSWDARTHSRHYWALESSQETFVALWSQQDLVTGQWEVRYGTYWWLP